MIVKAFANYGFAGFNMEFEEEIEETMKDLVMAQVSWSYEKQY